MAFLKGKGFRMLFASFVITCVHQLVNSHWLDRWLFRPLASHRASIAGGYSGGYSGGNKSKILHKLQESFTLVMLIVKTNNVKFVPNNKAPSANNITLILKKYSNQ